MAADGMHPGLAAAAGHLELLIQVLRGEPAAIEYAHLQSDPSIHAAPSEVPIQLLGKRSERLPGSRDQVEILPAAGGRRTGDAAGYSSSDRARAGGSNVLRGAGTSVAEIQSPPSQAQRRMAQQDGRRDIGNSTAVGSLSQSRSTGSLRQSGSGIVAKPSRGPGGGTAMDQAYNMSSSASSLPTDLDALRARLSAVIESKSRTGHPTASKPRQSGGLGSTASTAVPRDSKDARFNKEKFLASMDTPLTARSGADECVFVQDNAFNVVNDIVDTCVELEQAQLTFNCDDLNLSRAPEPSTPAQIWTARAALAAAASAEAASAAAEVAAAASAEAAREAAKCAAAAKAATGRYNPLVEYIMSGRSSRDVTMKPGGFPALTGPSIDSDSLNGSDTRMSRQVSNESEDDPEDGISQDKLEHEVVKVQKKLDIPLDAPVGLNEFKLVAKLLDMDADEAKEVFDEICEEKGVDVDESLRWPMEEYLEELHIDTDDHEGVENFVDALKKARKQLASRRPPDLSSNAEPVDNKVTTRQLLDKVVKHMDWQKMPAKDAWKYVNQLRSASTDKQILSHSELEVVKGFEKRSDEFVQKVSACMIDPPILNSCAGQVATKEICIRKVNEIIEKCKAEGTQFTDPEFDIQSCPSKCLYVDCEQPGFDCTVAPPATFKRLTTIVKKSAGNNEALSGMSSMFGGMGGKKAAGSKKALKPIVFKGEVKAGDVVQGQIGTCFLLGAIGAMASHREKSLHKIFIKYDVDVGVYGIRFCVDGEWTHVIVDDWMPVDGRGELMYARCKDSQEVWVPLLEKAFCKLHTCYEMCDGGEGTEALNTFFGGVTGKITVKKQHRKDPSRFFKLLKNARDKGWLLTTGFVKQVGAKSAGSGKCGEDMLPCGLVGGHAYSVLKIVEANGVQLIQCRNPWGTGEWTGKWSDGNEYGEWTDQMKAATGYVGLDDGKFWMSIEDFVTNTGGVDYARTFGPNWKKATHYVHFASCNMIATAKRNFKGKRSEHLSFQKGDEIKVKEMQGEIFLGNLKRDRSGEPKCFPGRYVKFNERPVLRFDIVATPAAGSKEPVIAVIMLMQRNIIMQRKYTKRKEDGMNYKDLNYAEIEIIIVHPDGHVAIRKQSRKRCVWGEVEMPGGGLWKVYALCNDGRGAPCSVRSYLKGGSLSFKEVKGCRFSEVAPLLFDDD